MTQVARDQMCINTIRTISMDAVQQANCGHPRRAHTRLTFGGAGDFTAENHSGNFYFGIREHAIGGILNGRSLRKVRPYGSGSGVAKDRLARQPEQLASLRAIPGLITLRVADAENALYQYDLVTQRFITDLDGVCNIQK